MAIEYTPSQQKVIDLRDRNILVSAAAGSGKTAVLVERILKMITEEGVDVDHILVVTFTAAAAAQMKERLLKAINDRLLVDGANEHLEKQAALIHNAMISTIHSFCLFLIKNHFDEAGIEPGFRIADEGEIHILRQDILEELLEDHFEAGDPDFLEFVESYGGNVWSRTLEAHIQRLFDFSRSYPYPETWLKTDHTGWVFWMLRDSLSVIRGCVGLMEKARDICLESDGPYMHLSVVEENLSAFSSILVELEKLNPVYGTLETEKTVSEIYGELRGICLRDISGRLSSKKDEAVSQEKRDAVADLRKKAREAHDKLKEDYYSMTPKALDEQEERGRKNAEMLIGLVLDFSERLARAKSERNIIDFSDMEHLALKILVEEGDTPGKVVPRETALLYRDYFHEIMIDEYQDSNLVQEYILRSISREDSGVPNRFMVGDVKQSIYRFRMARPELFLEKAAEYSAEDDKFTRIDLDANFRSRNAVLNGVNRIFGAIMRNEVGGIDYDEAASLKHGSVDPDIASDDTVELMLCIPEEEGSSGNSEAENSSSGMSSIRPDEQEAELAADRILELVGNFSVSAKEGIRPANFSDIVILLRSTSVLGELYEKVLARRGIPSYVTVDTGYFGAPEVMACLDYLNVINNPFDDIPLAGVMTSFFGGFDDEELAVIRSFCRRKHSYLWDDLKAFMDVRGEYAGYNASQIESLAARIKEFVEKIEALRNVSGMYTVRELLLELLISTGYLDHLLAMPDGEKRRANVEMLLVKASAFEKTSYYGIHHFVRYMEQLKKYQVDYGEARTLDENADLVRIMTIHKSKGLEFPICILPGLHRRLNHMDSRAGIVLDMDLGPAFHDVDFRRRIRRKSVRKAAVARKIATDSQGEELRVLYVAMTRARDKLIMSGYLPSQEHLEKIRACGAMEPDGRMASHAILGADSYMDMILPVVLADEQTSVVKLDIRCPGDAGGVNGVDAAGIDVKEMPGIHAPNSYDGAPPNMCDDKTAEEYRKLFHERFSFEYPGRNLEGLYTKTTVSEIKRLHMEEMEAGELPAPAPVFDAAVSGDGDDGKGKAAASDRGNAYHRIMEVIDFREYADVNDLENEFGRILNSGKAEEDTLKLVSPERILAFFRTDIGKRMINAFRAGLLYREVPFFVGVPACEVYAGAPESETVLIQGIIDAYFTEGDEIIVLDYKTDRVPGSEVLVQRYGIQLDYYARTLERLTHIKVAGKYIYSFHLGEEIAFEN